MFYCVCVNILGLIVNVTLFATLTIDEMGRCFLVADPKNVSIGVQFNFFSSLLLSVLSYAVTIFCSFKLYRKFKTHVGPDLNETQVKRLAQNKALMNATVAQAAFPVMLTFLTPVTLLIGAILSSNEVQFEDSIAFKVIFLLQISQNSKSII